MNGPQINVGVFVLSFIPKLEVLVSIILNFEESHVTPFLPASSAVLYLQLHTVAYLDMTVRSSSSKQAKCPNTVSYKEEQAQVQ